MRLSDWIYDEVAPFTQQHYDQLINRPHRPDGRMTYVQGVRRNQVHPGQGVRRVEKPVFSIRAERAKLAVILVIGDLSVPKHVQKLLEEERKRESGGYPYELGSLGKHVNTGSEVSTLVLPGTSHMATLTIQITMHKHVHKLEASS